MSLIRFRTVPDAKSTKFQKLGPTLLMAMCKSPKIMHKLNSSTQHVFLLKVHSSGFSHRLYRAIIQQAGTRCGHKILNILMVSIRSS